MAKLGYEVEGRFRDLYSIFLTPEELSRLVNRPDIIDKVGQIAVYDDNSIITREHLDIMMSFPERIILTLETPKLYVPVDIIPYRIHLVMVIKTNMIADLHIYHQVKFVDCANCVYMITKENMSHTHYTEFEDDKEIVL